MPKQYVEPEDLNTDGRMCSGLRYELKECLLKTDCVKKEKKTPRQCLVERHPSIPDQCIHLSRSFFECKRALLDNRIRFRGNRGY